MFNGKINQKKCRVLIDSGCEEIILSKEYSKSLGINTDKTNLKAELWDGTLVEMEQSSENLELQLGSEAFIIRPYIVDWIAYDIILGKSWLTEVNPLIDWKRNQVCIKKDNQIKSLDAEACSHRESHLPWMLSSKQLARLARKNRTPIYIVLLKPSVKKEKEEIQSQEIEELIEKNKDVFERPSGLPPKRNIEMKIELEEGTRPKMGPMYKLSTTELAEMKRQINELLANGYIRPSISPWGSPVLFIPKKDGGLRMCIDYRALNKKTIKNQVPLPRIDEVWDQIGGSKFFTTLDLKEGYHQIRIREKDIEKTAFRTRYGQFEYLVTPFGLTGAPGCFQTLMNNIFRKYLDEFVLVYLDDILIYSKTWDEHLEHIESVLKILRENKIYAKKSKCFFGKSETEYLGHVISEKGIQVNPKKTNAISNWEKPSNVKEIQSFIGLCNYYRRFIENFAKIAAPLTNLTKKNVPFIWDHEQQQAFENLKNKLVNAPILKYADPNIPYVITTDASEVGVGGVLSQSVNSEEHPVAYTSRKLNEAEQKYSTHERELLGIIHALKQWRPYLHGSKFTIKTDHHPLKYLESQKTLSRKQARWIEFMQEFNFDIEYLKGKLNKVADGLSRQNYKATQTSSNVISKLFALTQIELSNRSLQELEKEYKNDVFFNQIWEQTEPPYIKKSNRIYFEGRLCIPNGNLKNTILHDNHNSLLGGHRGENKTYELIKRDFFWPEMKDEIKVYVSSCQKCQESKSLNKKLAGKLRIFPPPNRKWEVISMDFMFKLPRTKDGYTGIMTVVDKLSKRAHFIPLTTNNTSEHIANVFYKEIFKHHGIPRKIISDRDTRFTSDLWRDFTKLLKIRLNLSTAFHPETDGQSERAFRTIQEMLRCYVSKTQTDWKKYLPGLEFSYNNHQNDATKLSPFFVEYGQNPLSVSDIITSEGSQEDLSSNKFIREIQKATRIAKESIQKSNTRNEDYVNKSRREFKFDILDKVMLSTKNLSLKEGRKKKLAPKWIGPFSVVGIYAQGTAYRLALPENLKKIHDTFHVSLLKPYIGNESSNPQMTQIVDLFTDDDKSSEKSFEDEC